MKLAITGAAGFVGRALTWKLVAAGHDVTALSRDHARAAVRLPARCRVFDWDPSGGVVAAGALRNADAVIHLAGEPIAGGRWNARRKTAIRESRVHGTRALITAIAQLPESSRPRALISASATGFYGDRGDEVLVEEASAGTGFLADVCREREREIATADALGVRTAALRIGVVLGRGGGALAKLLMPFRLGVGGHIGSGRQWMSWIHLDDVVDLLSFVAEGEAVRGAINAVAPVPVTNAQLTDALSSAVGRRAPFPVPAPLLKLALGEMATVLLASTRVVPGAASRFGFRFRYPELATALADLCGDGRGSDLEFEQWVNGRPAEVFRFFSDARNLEEITPDFLRFRVVDVSPPQMGKGTRIDYRLQLHGIPVRWQSRIDVWQPDSRFVDSQTRGPYHCWHHTHEFEPWQGGTIVRDRVHYEPPLGAVADALAGSIIARDVDAIFNYRRERIAEIFGVRTEHAVATAQ